MNWVEEKRWSDKFLREIKRNLGEFLIGEPQIEEDMLRNTDLTVLKLDSVRIACRIRRNSYLKQYGDEMTIRYSVPSGTKTEFEKIMEGWGDYFFYGFASEDEKTLERWFIGDLKAFRNCIFKHIKMGRTLNIKHNFGDTSFCVFYPQRIPNFIIASNL